MTPEQLARDAARLVDRLEHEQVRRIRTHIDSVRREANELIRGMNLRDTSTSRAIREARARALVAQSNAADRILEIARPGSPIAQAEMANIRRAYEDGMRSATVAVRDRLAAAGVDASDVLTAFAPRVDLELVNAITRSTLTTLERVAARGLAGLEDAIVRGAVRGAGPRVTARLVRESLDLTRYEAERITRTVYMRAANDARDHVFEDAEVRFVQADATNDARLCDYCAARHGMVYRVQDAPDFPLHPQCRCVLLPWAEDTPVSQRGDAYYQRERKEISEQPDRERVTARARAPFERADDREAPKPVWAPGRGWL